MSLDEGALALADVAFINTPGPDAVRVRAAIAAYQWAFDWMQSNDGHYPSFSDWLDHRAKT